MKIPKTTVQIAGKTLKVKQGLKTLLAYERGTGKNAFKVGESENLTEMVDMLFYSLYVNNSSDNFTMTKEELEDYLDDNPAPLGQYTSFLRQVQEQALSAMQKTIEEAQQKTGE